MPIHGVRSGGIERPTEQSSRVANGGNSNRGIDQSQQRTNKAIQTANLPSTRALFGTKTQYNVGKLTDDNNNQYSMKISPGLLGRGGTMHLMNQNGEEKGSAKYRIDGKTLHLEHIQAPTDYKSNGEPIKGKGAMLVYEMARKAQGQELPGQKGPITQIDVSSAARGGFYPKMGFQPNPQHVENLENLHVGGGGLPLTPEEMNTMSNDHVTGDLNTVLQQSGNSVANHWSGVQGPATQTLLDWASSLVGLR